MTGETEPLRAELRDVSSTGARIKVDPKRQMPDRFTLALTVNQTVVRHCRVVWSDAEGQNGLDFIASNENPVATWRKIAN